VPKRLKLIIMNLFIIAGVIGPWQIVLIIAVALLFFGGKKIPELMQGLGKGMKEFKKAMKDDEQPVDQTEEKKKEPLKE
jgi:sec-independent protein translocase protein TatA